MPKTRPMIDILNEMKKVVEAVGHTPRYEQYETTRKELQREARLAGNPIALASYDTIHKHFPTWDDALAAIGEPPLGGRHTPAKENLGRKRTYTDEQILAEINRARRQLGEITANRYDTWRIDEIAADPFAAFRIPSAATARARFGSWDDALSAADGATSTVAPERWTRQPSQRAT